jgi:hypothetical protein
MLPVLCGCETWSLTLREEREVGLPYLYHRKRGHFPLIDHEKEEMPVAKGVSKFWSKKRIPRGLEDPEHPCSPQTREFLVYITSIRRRDHLGNTNTCFLVLP